MGSVPVEKSASALIAENVEAGGRDVAIDYVRAIAVAMVVLIHAAGAYLSVTRSEFRFLASLEPIVDARRGRILDLLGIFDFFLMPSLFLVSGLVSFSSLERRGARGFFFARLKRLGIPFLVGALLLAPLAHWPSYLLADPRPETSYLKIFFSSGWPSDHLWFIWLLLAFDGVAALAHWLAPTALQRLGRRPAAPTTFVVAMLSFVPLSLLVPNYIFVSWGPFSVEPARVGLYLACFLMGLVIGAGDEWRRPGWPGRWWVWLLVGLASSGIYTAGLWPLDAAGKPLFPPPVGTLSLGHRIAFGAAFAATCAGLSLGFLGFFRKHVERRRPVLESLSANSFGIYLFHYALVFWFQFALLQLPWPPAIKCGIVFAGALALSWGATALLRRAPAVRRVL